MHEHTITSSTPPTTTSFVTPNHPEWSRLNFPLRLHHLLASMEEEGLGHMAHWDEHGLCFKISKSDELIQKYLPFFFHQRRWKSFQRQMNIYSFKRIPSGPLKGYYCHPFFKRSDISMAQKVQRKKQKSELSSEALIQASEDYSCPVVSGLLCLSQSTTLDFSYSSSFNEEDDGDVLLGFHRLSSTVQGRHGPDPSSQKDKASGLVRPLALVSLSSESEDTSGAGFRSYNHVGGIISAEHGMDDAAIFRADPQGSSYCSKKVPSDAVHTKTSREPAYYFGLSENKEEEDWVGAANHLLSSGYHVLPASSEKQQERGAINHPRGSALEQLVHVLDDDDASIATIDDLTGLMILNLQAELEDVGRSTSAQGVSNRNHDANSCILSN